MLTVVIALSIWFLLGAFGAMGTAFASGYTIDQNTTFGRDIFVVTLGPLGFLFGMTNMMACLGSKAKRG